jgi:hypothetical protein
MSKKINSLSAVMQDKRWRLGRLWAIEIEKRYSSSIIAKKFHFCRKFSLIDTFHHWFVHSGHTNKRISSSKNGI